MNHNVLHWSMIYSVDHENRKPSEVNECTRGLHTCNASATCNNTAGSFTCSCNTGYSGDGHSCVAGQSWLHVGGGGRGEGIIVMGDEWAIVSGLGL